MCIGNNLFVLNGRTMGDFLGQFTCHTYNGASVVNYVIGSRDLQSSTDNFSIGNINEFSHHCCLSFVMRVNISGRLEDDIELTHHPKSFVWDPSMSNCLRDIISSHEVQNKLISFLYVCMVKTIYLFSWWKHHVNLLLQSFRSVSSDLHQF